MRRKTWRTDRTTGLADLQRRWRRGRRLPSRSRGRRRRPELKWNPRWGCGMNSSPFSLDSLCPYSFSFWLRLSMAESGSHSMFVLALLLHRGLPGRIQGGGFGRPRGAGDHKPSEVGTQPRPPTASTSRRERKRTKQTSYECSTSVISVVDQGAHEGHRI